MSADEMRHRTLGVHAAAAAACANDADGNAGAVVEARRRRRPFARAREIAVDAQLSRGCDFVPAPSPHRSCPWPQSMKKTSRGVALAPRDEHLLLCFLPLLHLQPTMTATTS